MLDGIQAAVFRVRGSDAGHDGALRTVPRSVELEGLGQCRGRPVVGSSASADADVDAGAKVYDLLKSITAQIKRAFPHAFAVSYA